MKTRLRLQRNPRDLSLSRLLGPSFTTSLLFTALLLQAAMPPDPSVEMRFAEGPEGAGSLGVTTTNSGWLEGTATFFQDLANLNETVAYPVFSTNVPVGAYVPAVNQFSVDMGGISGACADGQGGRAVDLITMKDPYGMGYLGPCPKLTICGWVNNQRYASYSDGDRIAYALQGPDGFELVMRQNGQLALAVNQGNAGTSPGSTATIPVDSGADTDNWTFFAASYDPTLPADQLKYYFGRANRLAGLDSAHTYTGGQAYADIQFTGPLSVGNGDTAFQYRNATGSCSREVRGLIDELTIYTNALTLDEIQQAQLNGVVPPTPASILQEPDNVTRVEGQDATFSVETSGSGLVTYQWRTNGVAIPGATNTTFTLSGVSLAQSGLTVSVLVDNDVLVDPIPSQDVKLTVVPSQPKIVHFAFSESEGTSTLNSGALGGTGAFRMGSGFPVFAANVPTGPFAPTANTKGLDQGPAGSWRAVNLTSNLISPEGKLGNMDALTICGWVNSANQTFRTTSHGRGTRIVNASLGDNNGGFVLSYRNNSLGNSGYGENGRLKLDVNEWRYDTPIALSSTDTVPLDTNTPPGNWVFFAVTYDGTSSTDNLKFYFGNGDTAAAMDGVPISYPQGVIAATGPLTVGCNNLSPGYPSGNVNGDNGAYFRGLMDEIKIFNKVLTLEEIRAEQVAAPPALPPPPLNYMVETNHLVLIWSGSYQLQSRPDLGAGSSWSDVADPPTVDGNTRSLAVPLTGGPMFFRLRE